MAERSWWARLRGRLRAWRGGPAPGRWHEGRAFAWRGLVGWRPWVFPRRRYRVYVPRGWSRDVRAPLVVLLHGCRQTAADLAAGTRIVRAADDAGALLLMPDQKDAANPWRCWNWFDGCTAAGRGEAAIVAAMIRRTVRRCDADPDRVVAAGLSSGAALAAVLGVRYPSLVRGVFAHSGLACGAAASPLTAITVMRRGPDVDVAAIARAARAAAAGDVEVPLVVVHGTADDVVARLNADALARQYLALNGVDVPPGAATTLPPPDAAVRDEAAPLRTVRTRAWRRGGRTLVRIVEVDDLAHAWSGGDPALPFHDGAPPDATALLVDWAVAGAR